MKRGCYFLSVQTSRIIADEDRQEALEFSRELVVTVGSLTSQDTSKPLSAANSDGSPSSFHSLCHFLPAFALQLLIRPPRLTLKSQRLFGCCCFFNVFFYLPSRQETKGFRVHTVCPLMRLSVG